MRIPKALITFLISLIPGAGYALQPDQILIIANGDIPPSGQIARYYCAKRGVPPSNIFTLPLGTNLNNTITRDSYEKRLVEPIRIKLRSPEFAGKIRCLLTTYGIPVSVGPRGPLKDKQDKLSRLKILAEQEKNKLEMLNQNSTTNTSGKRKDIKHKLTRLQSEIDYIVGKETTASTDSELSMVLFGGYELYRWQPNRLSYKMPYWDFKSLMVCRLDGAVPEIIKALVDKAITTEKTGLMGIAYIDSRGLPADKKPYSTGYFDQSLRDLALMIRTRTQLPVIEERTNALFAPGQCPSAALYCGWYSLKKYIDAFDFVEGAIGYHISSLEALELRDPNSSQWCPAMLKDGITATMGAVAEPYLHSFPQPKAFFAELLDGRCLVEAYYRTKPFNSWQMVLIGDPLYTPFKKPQVSPLDNF